MGRDFLTGFHKRKQARRRFGLAMQEIKDRKQRLEERKEVRSVVLQYRQELSARLTIVALVHQINAEIISRYLPSLFFFLGTTVRGNTERRRNEALKELTEYGTVAVAIALKNSELLVVPS